MGPRRPDSASRWIGLALAAAVLVVYGRVLGHDFVSIDDPTYVYANPVVRSGLSWTTAKWAFSGFHFDNWHPLTWLSYLLDVSLFGRGAAGILATNALLHAAASVLLFVALRAMTGAVWPSALVAALFAVNPLRVESVAWVSSRKDVLSGVFAMLTLVAYTAYARRPGALRYAAVVMALVSGLAAKSMLVTLPIVLLLLDYWPLRRLQLAGEAATATPAAFSQRSALALAIEKLPLFALSMGFGVITVLAQRASAVRTLASLSFGARLENALIACCVYLGKFAWPTDLAFFYAHPAFVAPDVGRTGRAAVAAFVLAAVTWVVAGPARRYRYLVVGWLWYLVTLAPVIGLLQVGDQAVADRYTYLPLIGPCIALAWGLCDWAARDPRAARAARTGVALVLPVFAFISWLQVGTWHDSETLYRHALAVTRGNYVAHNNLGLLLHERGEFERAREQYESALRIAPHYALALSNLGNTYVSLGDAERAVVLYGQAMRAKPDFAEPYNNLGAVYERSGALEQAAASYARAIEIDPGYLQAHHNLGSLLKVQGDLEGAAAHLEQAIALDPEFAPALNNLAGLYQARGDYDRALALFERALTLQPDSAEIHTNVANLLARRGELDRALGHFERALELEPDLVEAHLGMGTLWVREGDLAAAAAQLDRALALAPSDPKVHFNRAAVYEQQGRRAEAAAHYARALELEPGFEPARAALARTAEPAP